jgi:hypothetical protein
VPGSPFESTLNPRAGNPNGSRGCSNPVTSRRRIEPTPFCSCAKKTLIHQAAGSCARHCTRGKPCLWIAEHGKPAPQNLQGNDFRARARGRPGTGSGRRQCQRGCATNRPGSPEVGVRADGSNRTWHPLAFGQLAEVLCAEGQTDVAASTLRQWFLGTKQKPLGRSPICYHGFPRAVGSGGNSGGAHRWSEVVEDPSGFAPLDQARFTAR